MMVGDDKLIGDYISGRRLHNELKYHHAIDGTTHSFYGHFHPFSSIFNRGSIYQQMEV